MKKNLFIVLSFLSILLVWCSNPSNQAKQIDPDKWLSENWVTIEETFNNQIKDFQYIKDLENYISYNILSITEDKPFTSDFSFETKFNKNSSIQWWINFSQNKVSKTHDLEISDIKVNVETQEKKGDLEPFSLSWSLSLLYRDNEVYAKLHDLWVFMWEGNMTAKMYTLLWDLIIDNRVNLEVHSWWIVTINEEEYKKLPNIIWSLENILKTENIQSSPDFLWSIADIIDIINSYIKLWISTDELKITNYETSYYELSDKTIQKSFSWSFQWKQSAFDLLLVSSKNWLAAVLHNIKEYDEDTLEFKDTNSEFSLTLKENKESEYSINILSLKNEQETINLKWNINYNDTLNFSADFDFEPIEFLSWQKISWKLNWNIIKKSWNWDEIIPELTGSILSLTEILSSL